MLDLDRHTVFITLAGSHAHGTSGPQSDIDLRGVCIAPLSVRLSLHRRFEQFEGTLQGALWDAVLPRLLSHETARRSLGGKVETIIYDMAKFLELCARANPNALEILFADERDSLFRSEGWDQLQRQRHRFLTREPGGDQRHVDDRATG
jgi:predicted nucleotidyltransferase